MQHTVHNKLIRISSFYKETTSASNSDFSSTYDVAELQNTLAIVVKHVSFPNVFYNVTARNNQFSWWDGAVTTTTVTLPVGQYNISTLMTDLNTLLAGDIVITQDPLTLLLTFTNGSGGNATVFYENANNMSKLLGITENTLIANGASAIMNNLPALQGVSHVYVNSIAVSKANNMCSPNTVQVSPTVVMIPINVPFGETVHYETQHEELDLINYDGVKDLSAIDIKLVDIEGNILDLQGQDFTMILKTYYELQH
jgi:hypothetical protein